MATDAWKGDLGAPGWRTYRCPVCSHMDSVLMAGADEVLIRCSHCDTPLRVGTRPGDPQNASATVAAGRKEPERA